MAQPGVQPSRAHANIIQAVGCMHGNAPQAIEGTSAHAGQPLRELGLPVDHDGVGHDDEVRPVVVLVLHQVRDQRHHLQGGGIAARLTPRAQPHAG